MLNKISIRTMLSPAAALCLLSGFAANAGDWQRLSPPGAGFSIMMPGAPKTMDQTVQTKAGPLVMHVFGTETGKIGYAVMYGDYKMQMEPKKALEGVRDGEVGTGKLLAEENISAGGSPGKRIVVAMADGNTLVSQFFLAGTKLYQVMYIAPSAPQEALQEAAPFMKSFQLGR
jgi:hypothetical protein